ncbi:MAG TPA: hypothetical protein EYP06_09205 [Desulfobacterales bacterium]|nr:hypothetical protein [Desulfobacterales bacterium]
MNTCPVILQIALLSAIGAVILSAMGRHPGLTGKLLFLASVCVTFHILRRVVFHWPYTPLYMGSEQVAALAGLGYSAHALSTKSPVRASAFFVSVSICLLILAVLFFPKDYYLPNPRADIAWAHAFLWSDALARAIFIIAGGKALDLHFQNPNSRAGHLHTPSISIGIAVMALSMSFGIGWSAGTLGVPVTFHDHQEMLGFILIWFYWMFVVHLATTKTRPLYLTVSKIVGSLLVLTVTIYQNLGIWRLPCLN